MKSVKGSFRDPSGFVFEDEGVIYRQVNKSYKENYDYLMESGTYDILTKAGLLISHEEVDLENSASPNAYKVLRPERIPFISYPHEWCFSQLKDAALTTLKIQEEAIELGMSLKDSSVYNIQFLRGKPIFIDTLSFERYQEGKPWVAYRQFCQHFLAPLALMSKKDVRLNQLSRIHLDGVPLDLASSLLPLHTRANFSILTHIHLHSRSQKHFEKRTIDLKRGRMGKRSMLGLIDSLKSAVEGLEWQAAGTEWADYYGDTNYSTNSIKNKKEIIEDLIEQVKPTTIWDLGSNIGMFSRLCSDKGIQTVSIDIDPAAVEKNYREMKEREEINILPLLLDLANPSPGIGWENRERLSLEERGPADTVLALALIHHLAISNNLPFEKIAGFFFKVCNSLIIEFIPKNDSNVQSLLSTREDIFLDYTQQAFENEFQKYFEILKLVKIRDSERMLYLLEKRHS